MPSPALIIGLGGTGTLVATYIKKELLETSGGNWPLKEVKVLAFDTDNKPPDIGAQGKIRRAGQSTGAVRLSSGEFFFIGGNVQGLMRQVAKGRYPHIGKWLLADWYLQNLSDKMFNLNEGAGQFRQFGRLAVFKDVATPANSTIFNTISDALTKLSRDNPDMPALQVFIIASLAGGTGAGMFADIAYIVRKVANQSSIDLKKMMSIRGYLVLPDAFSHTVDSTWLRSMNARAFAAMRENRRFAISFDYKRGYPMHYRESMDDELWHGSLKGRLFDLLYYIDGNGDSKLNTKELSQGVAPMIADAIGAAIDRESGPAFSTYVANVEAERNARLSREELSRKTATFGSVGTYSIVYPIYQIIEGWTHDFGLDVLNVLTQPADKDPRTGLPLTLSPRSNQENPGEDGMEEATQFLRATRPIAYQERDAQGNLQTSQAEPTLLYGELARIATLANRTGSASLQELMARDIEEWKLHFFPHGEDTGTQRLLRRIERTLNIRLYDANGGEALVVTSDQMKPKEDPAMGAERIAGGVRKHKAYLLGDEDPHTGQRQGGSYRDALRQVSDYQVERFRLYLNTYIQATLNGSPNRLATESRGGKIGFLEAFLDELFRQLVQVQEVLQRVQNLRRDKGESRRTALADTQAALQRMKSLASKRNIMGRPAREAYQAQHAYLQAETRLIEMLEREAIEEALLNTVTLMLEYVDSARDAISGWIQALATASNSLYAHLLRGREQVKSDLAAEKNIHCRLVLDDKEYQKERYRYYLSRAGNGWLNKILSTLKWELRIRQQGGRPKLDLALAIQTEEDSPPTLLTPRHSDINLSAWLQACRQPFEMARDTESVIGYLLHHDKYRNPESIATLLHQNGGTSLNFSGGNPLPANFLRAYFQTEEEAGHRAYLRNVIQELAQRRGMKTAETQEEGSEDRFAKFTNSEDRFKFTVVFTQELIELERLSAYDAGKLVYLGHSGRGAGAGRRILHIFPAEVHAAEYETRLPELNQSLRLFADDVALQLEDKEQFRLFLMCYTYGLIRREAERDPNTNATRFVFKLFIPPEKEEDEYGNPAQTDEIWLTEPRTELYMLDAITTFNFVGRDVGHGETYTREINYSAVSSALHRIREQDAARRVQDMDFRYNRGLLPSIQAVRDEKKRQNMLLELASIERISARRDHFKNAVLPYYAKLLPEPHAQNDYDLATIFWMMLSDEVKVVQQTLTEKIRTLRDLGLIADDNLPPSSLRTL